MTEWAKTEIEGAYIRRLVSYADERGGLSETFRADELPVKLDLVMSYTSYTNPSFSRGPHEHSEQTDLFIFSGPGDFTVKLWDNRKDHSTFEKSIEMVAGASNPVAILIPPGVVHGYKNTSEVEAFVINYCDRLYRGVGKRESVDEIRYEDVIDSKFKL